MKKRVTKGNRLTVKLSLVLFFVIVISGLFFLFAIDSVASSPGKSGGRLVSQCSDHLDNDGDGRCDYSWRKAYCSDGSILGDSDCISRDDNNEGSSCNIACTSNSNCGTDGYIGGNYCGSDGNVYRDYRIFTCQNAGSCSSVCSSSLVSSLVVDCQGLGCNSGQCNSSQPVVGSVKIAFIGDQGINSNAKAVLQLIKSEGAEAVIHAGDLGYGVETDVQTAINWDSQINSILGLNFPYFVSVGNHDVSNWNVVGGYQDLAEARLARVNATCTGDLGVRSSCYYKGIFFILSGAGTLDSAATNYITTELAGDSSVWRICSWHKNQQAMQIGGKTDEVGWGPYEACRNGRAIIATAHEHSYERTKNLINIQTQAVDSAWNSINMTRVAAGSTFVFVSGLGGQSIRSQLRCLPKTYPYGCSGEWASIYTSDQGANYGALFCTFNVDGDANKASCYFKDISGRILDRFDVISEV